jgi:putative DNA primase/helicase
MVDAGMARFADGVEKLAQAHRSFAVTVEQWDRDPWLLGTPAGTVDLRTGILQPAARDDYITRQTAVAPADTADCPKFLAFLQQSTGNDEGMIAYLRRWFGYGLTGVIFEHVLQFLYGPGGNGKGVLLNTAFRVMGDYAVNAAIDTFLVTRGDKHSTDLAMLAGARFVMTTELDEGREWAEARIKALTGGDPITARFMRRDNFTFAPRFKLTISGNHKPDLRNVDDAMRRRFYIIPFLLRPEHVDGHLTDNLKQEWPQILRWMIEGCLEWQRVGLNAPKAVVDATDQYFMDQNIVRHWIDACCEEDPKLIDTSANLFASWSEFADASGERPRTTKWLTQTLIRQGFTSVKEVPGHRGKRGFEGIRAKPGLFSQYPRWRRGWRG